MPKCVLVACSSPTLAAPYGVELALFQSTTPDDFALEYILLQ